MKTLNQNWFFADLMDVEYKKYVLLAYLQDVQHYFNQTKLYPALAELVQHYRNLSNFNSQKQKMYSSFKQEITGVDFEKFKIAYTKVVTDDELMKTLEEVIDFSIPKIKKVLEEGKEIYEFVENEVNMEPVGILPLYQKEGYLLININANLDVKVYEYQVKLFERNFEKYRTVSTTYMDSFKKSIINTTENIKLQMVNRYKKLPNPATFAVNSNYYFPLDETLLQIAKRKIFSLIKV